MAGLIKEEPDALTSVTLILSQDYYCLKSRQGSDKKIAQGKSRKVSPRACEMPFSSPHLGSGILNGTVQWA